MQKSISILKYHSFSEVEKKDFKLFLRNRKEDKEVLAIVKFVNSVDSFSKLNQENACNSIYKKHGKSEENRLNKALSRFNKSIDSYIVKVYKFQDEEYEISNLLKLLRFANLKNLDFLFEKTEKKLIKELKAYPYQDTFYYEAKYKISKEKVDYLSKQQKRKEDLQLESKEFNDYILLQKLVQVTKMFNKLGNVKKNYEHPVYDLLKHSKEIEQLTEGKYSMKIWYNCTLLLQDGPNISLWEETISDLKANYSIFTNTDASHLFIILENLLSLQKLDRVELHKRLLDLYLFQIDHKLLFYEGFILPTTFVNIVTVALTNKGTEWVIAFIEKNKDHVVLASRYFVYNYCMAQCLVENKEIDKAIKHLRRLEDVNHKNIHLNMAARRLFIKALYTQNQETITDSNKLMQVIYSYKKYIHDKDNEIPEFHRRINLDFVNFVNRILEANTIKKKAKLEQDILETKILSDQEWLLEVVSQL